MARAKIRHIVVDGTKYFWRYAPSYEKVEEPGVFCRCRDTFIAYKEGHRRSPVRITLITYSDPITGGPLRCGGRLFLHNDAPTGIHLHKPKWAAAMIRAALRHGWKPKTIAKPYEITDGLKLLESMNYLAD